MYPIRWDDYINPLDFMPASAFDYYDWLISYVKNGGEPTHYYDHPLTTGQFLIALRDIDVMPRYGAGSVKIIVPKGINADIIGLGHNGVYFHGRRPKAVGYVPVFNNPVFMQVPEFAKGVKQARVRDERFMRESDMRLWMSENQSRSRKMRSGTHV